MNPLRIHGAAATVVMSIAWAAGCATSPDPPPDESDGGEPAPSVVVERGVGAEAVDEPVDRDIPYEGAFGPSDPPRPPLPPGQTPLDPWVVAALDVWWERPSPRGPEPIPVDEPKAIRIEGRGPVIQALPGPTPFPDMIPERLRTVYPERIPYSNRVERLPRGEIRIVAFDNTYNDTKLSDDSMAVEIEFTDFRGDEWRIEQVVLAPISSNPIAEPWFGGLVIDTLYHGHTGNGTPAEPLVRCMMCSWGWADVYKNGVRVASSALLHVMLTSDVRGDDFEYACYDCAERPVREVHVIVPPMFYLPAPGGFLHIMWENAEWERGPPERIAARAPELGEDVPTIRLRAAPYLRWSPEEIRVEAGRKYRLLVTNDDPSSFHQFRLHPRPEGEAHGDEDLRHEHGGTAGRIGGLWRPGEAPAHAHDGDPPAPRDVFLTLPQGATWATFVEFEEPGVYEFMCPVTNHYRRGMHGRFVVTPRGQGGER